LKTLLWRAAPRVWRFLSTPSAERGTWAAEFGTLITAVLMGVFYWLLRRP
jgi:hypothetical protein